MWIYSVAVTGQMLASVADPLNCKRPHCSKKLCDITTISTGRILLAGSAGAMLSLAAMPADGASITSVGPRGVIGWASAEYAALGIYLGVGPGIIGHVGFNFLLLYLSPLVLTLAQTLDPPIGAFIGERLMVSMSS